MSLSTFRFACCFVLAIAMTLMIGCSDRTTPTASEIRSAIDGKLNAADRSVVETKTKQQGVPEGLRNTYTFTATLEVREPLYEQVTFKVAMSGQSLNDAGLSELAAARRNEGDSPRVMELAGIRELPASPENLVFLRESAKRGAKYDVSGKLVIERTVEGKWDSTFSDVVAQTAAPAGKPLSAFTDPIVLDSPAGKDRIKQIADQLNEIATKLADARARIRQEQEERGKQELARFAESVRLRRSDNLELIAPGSIFSGLASRSEGSPLPLSIEITDINKERGTLRALLRNDGGWSDSRRLEGTFSFTGDLNDPASLLPKGGPDSTTAQVILRAGQEGAKPNCGPFLSDQNSFELRFSLGSPKLETRVGQWAVALDRVPDDERDSFVSRQRELETTLLDAVKVGTVYEWVRTTPKEVQEYWLVINKNEHQGGSLAGLVIAKWSLARRPVVGRMITNSYMARGRPLVIESKGEFVNRSERRDTLIHSDWGDYSWAVGLRYDDGVFANEEQNYKQALRRLKVDEVKALRDSGKLDVATPTAPPTSTPNPDASHSAPGAEPANQREPSTPDQPTQPAPSPTTPTSVPSVNPADAGVPTLPSRIGVFALLNGTWKQLPRPQGVMPVRPTNQEFQADVKAKPDGPWVNLTYQGSLPESIPEFRGPEPIRLLVQDQQAVPFEDLATRDPRVLITRVDVENNSRFILPIFVSKENYDANIQKGAFSYPEPEMKIEELRPGALMLTSRGVVPEGVYVVMRNFSGNRMGMVVFRVSK